MTVTLVRPRAARARPTRTRPALAAFAGVATLITATHIWGVRLSRATRLGLGTPPLHAAWSPHWSSGVTTALGFGLVLLVVLPPLAATVDARQLAPMVSAIGASWAVVLAASVGLGRGLIGGVVGPHGFLPAVARVHSPVTFLHSFTAAARAGTLPVHVTGHPPGFVLVLWLLARGGLRGPYWAAALCIAGGALALGFIVVTVRELVGEPAARAAAPFLVLSPAAVWIATTPDAFFAGIAAAAIALFALATSAQGRRHDTLAAFAGVVFAAALMLSYGLVLVAFAAVAIAWSRRAGRALAILAATTVATLLALAPFGFWWPAGLAATANAYSRGIASTRPYGYFVFANIAALVICAGPAVAVAVTWLRRNALGLFVGTVLVVIAMADVSGMSKGEVERIWLPFTLWLLPAGGVFASRRGWTRTMLGVQLATAIALQALVRTS
jgi:hypothetical protein